MSPASATLLGATTVSSRVGVFVNRIAGAEASVSVSVDELLPGVGSVAPLNAAVAVLTRLPVALPRTVVLIVYVTLSPAGMETESLMFPLPLALQVARPVPVHVHVIPINEAGKVSVTTPSESPFPTLLTVIVYVMAAPGI